MPRSKFEIDTFVLDVVEINFHRALSLTVSHSTCGGSLNLFRGNGSLMKHVYCTFNLGGT